MTYYYMSILLNEYKYERKVWILVKFNFPNLISQSFWKRNQVGYNFTWHCGRRTRLVNPLLVTCPRWAAAIPPQPIWGNWSKLTTRFPFLNHFIRPRLHCGTTSYSKTFTQECKFSNQKQTFLRACKCFQSWEAEVSSRMQISVEVCTARPLGLCGLPGGSDKSQGLPASSSDGWAGIPIRGNWCVSGIWAAGSRHSPAKSSSVGVSVPSYFSSVPTFLLFLFFSHISKSKYVDANFLRINMYFLN